MDVHVCIFSYNRGPFLENCAQSVLRMTPDWPMKIYDDGSDDPETLEVLRRYEGTVFGRRTADGRYGGLHVNMQRALDEAQSDVVLFTQDDHQIVRPIDQADLDYISDYFTRFPDAAFLDPAFLRGHRQRSIRQQIRIVPGFPGYCHEISERWKRRSVTMYYTDVVVAHVGRLRAVNWAFLTGETANADLVRQFFPRMTQMAHPFSMNVPEVPVYRGKKKTMGVRLAERIAGMGVKAYRPMTAEEVARMRARDLSVYPFAEDFLTTEIPVRRPFVFNSMNIRWYTRALHKLELRLRR
ncbi:MAG: glycosyltransferase family A protein [Patescibacteria group bacterium]|nr:glycosyltransferase family A protein [Patescibacteria group bacterium]